MSVLEPIRRWFRDKVLRPIKRALQIEQWKAHLWANRKAEELLEMLRDANAGFGIRAHKGPPPGAYGTWSANQRQRRLRARRLSVGGRKKLRYAR